MTRALDFRRGRIYHGTWGVAPFQRLYHPPPHALSSLSLIPEWYLAIPALVTLSALGILWRPLLLAIPLVIVAAAIPIVQGWLSTRLATFHSAPPSSRTRLRRLRLRMLTALLHVMHPVARLCGRLSGPSCEGAGRVRPCVPVPGSVARWTERGEAPEARVRGVETMLQALGSTVRRGGDWDAWDLEVRCGAFGAARLIMAIEDHGAGNQLIRARWWPTVSAGTVGITVAAAALAVAAAFDHAWTAADVLALAAIVVAVRGAWQCGAAIAVMERSVCETQGKAPAAEKAGP